MAGVRAVLGDDEQRRRLAAWAGAVLLAVLAFSATWRATPTGAFAGTDSQTYLAVAGNLRDGQGLTSSFTNEYDGTAPTVAIEREGRHPLLLWPPLYPVALAAGSLFGVAPDAFARTVGALGAAVTALLTVRLGRRLSGSTLAGMAIAALFFANVSTQLLFATISSESLYTPLLVGGALALARALDEPDARHLGLLGALAAAAALTRYTGLGLIAAVFVSVRLWADRPAEDRSRLAWLVALGAVAPLVLWTVATRLAAEATNRAIGWYDRFGELGDFAGLLADWVVPPDDLTGDARPWIVVAIGVACVVALVAWLHLADRADRADAEQQAVLAARSTLLVVLGHLGFVVGAAFVLDRSLAMDQRMLMPVIPLVLALVVGGPAWWLRDHLPAPARWVPVSLVAAVALIGGLRVWEPASRIIVFSDLPGVLDPQLDEATAGVLAQLPEDVTVFSNSPTALFALTGRGSMALPYQRYPMSGADNDAYPDDLAAFAELLRDRDAWFVWYLPTSALTDYLAPERTVVRHGDLELVAESPEVRLYRVRPEGSGPPAPP